MSDKRGTLPGLGGPSSIPDAAIEMLRDMVRRYPTEPEVYVDICRRVIKAESRIRELEEQLEDLGATLNTPETADFFKGVPLEAAHQRLRWGSEHDAGKTPADWFWLVGYLAGKCLQAHILGDVEKALHHTISTAATLANWHMNIKGAGDMRPGIDTPFEQAGKELEK